MSKFKVGDLVYAKTFEHKDWQYKVLETDLKDSNGKPLLLLEYVKTPDRAAVRLGSHVLLGENWLAKLPTVVRSAPMWHVYYLDVHGGVQISVQDASDFKTENDVRNYILNYRGMSVLEITKVEREFEIE